MPEGLLVVMGPEPRALCVPGKNLTKIYFQSPKFLIITTAIFLASIDHRIGTVKCVRALV